MLVPQLTRSIQMLMETLITNALLEGHRVFPRASAAGSCDRFGNAGNVLEQSAIVPRVDITSAIGTAVDTDTTNPGAKCLV